MMVMKFELTMLAALMVCWTCLHPTGASATSRQQMSDSDASMKEAIMEARQETEELRSMLSTVIQRLDEQGVTIERQNGVNEGQNDVIEGQNDVIEGQNTVISELRNQIEHLMAVDDRHDDESNQIAFSVVSHQVFGPVSENTNIPYEIIHTNVGNGWSAVTNAFHVIVPGLYLFTTSMLTDASSTTTVQCHIVHSDIEGQTRVASMYGLSGSNYGDANSAIIELAAGDVVSVQLQSGGGMLSSYDSAVRSTFSGVLLF